MLTPTEEDAKNSARLVVSHLKQFRPTAFNYDCLSYEAAYNTSELFITQLVEAYVQSLTEGTAKFWRWFANLESVPAWFSNKVRVLADLVDGTAYIVDSDLQKHVATYTTTIAQGYKVIVIGHSQGNFYANQAYNVLFGSQPQLSQGTFSVLSVATPDSYVAGNGPYTTLTEDFIWSLPLLPPPLPPTTSNGPCGDPFFACHSFDVSYLPGTRSGPRILDHIVAALPTQSLPPLPPPPSNQPPAAGFLMTSGTQSATHGQNLNLTVPVGSTATVGFNGAPPRSSDPDGTVVAYEWSINSTMVSTASTFGQSFQAGTHTISLVVVDNVGARSGAAQGTIVVSEFPSNPVNISNTSSNEKRPTLSVDTAGIVHAAWWTDATTAGQILYSRSSNNGASFSPPIPVNGSFSSQLPSHISIGSDGQGSVYVAWYTWGSTQLASSNVFIANSRDGGQSFSQPVVVPQDLSRYGNVSTKLSLAAKPGGTVFVAWDVSLLAVSPLSRLGVVVVRSSDFGGTFSAPIVFHDRFFGDQQSGIGATDPSLAVDGLGRVFLAYNDVGHLAMGRSLDNGVSFSALSGPSATNWSGFEGGPDLSADAANRIHVGFNGKYTASADGGTSFSAVRTAYTGLPGIALWHQSFSVSPDGQNIIFLVEGDMGSGNVEIYSVRSVDGGATFSSLTNISNNSGQSGESGAWIYGGSRVIGLLTGRGFAIWHDNTPGNYDVLVRTIP